MNKHLATAALAAAVVLAAASSAEASMVVPFKLSGPNFYGKGTLTVEPNVSPADPNPLCGTPGENPCRHDPPGAWRITDIAGTFTDRNIGIVHAAITGLIPISPTNEHDPIFDPLVPASLSYLPANLSYNNLFFPYGNPLDCNFPFWGTFVDVFGVAFTIAGGYSVDFWGDGNMGPGGALTYGAAVSMGDARLDYLFAGITADAPEPLTLTLFGAGLIGAGFLRRRKTA